MKTMKRTIKKNQSGLIERQLVDAEFGVEGTKVNFLLPKLSNLFGPVEL